MSNSKKPWELYPHIWKTESAYMAFIRGGIRKALWNRYPIKTITIQKKRKRIPNPNPRGKVGTVWGGECYICKQDFPQKDLQVDHIDGNHSLKSIDDIRQFIEGLLFISEDDLALVCKPCHKAKSYAERMGISLDEALIEKQVIDIMKKSKKEIDNYLSEYGLSASNDKQRRESVRKILKGGTK